MPAREKKKNRGPKSKKTVWDGLIVLLFALQGAEIMESNEDWLED